MDLSGPAANQKGLPSTTVPSETVLGNSEKIWFPLSTKSLTFTEFKQNGASDHFAGLYLCLLEDNKFSTMPVLLP